MGTEQSGQASAGAVVKMPLVCRFVKMKRREDRSDGTREAV